MQKGAPLSIAVLVVFLCGCSTVHLREEVVRSKVEALRADIQAIGPDVYPGDASRAADAAVRYSLQLAGEYHATPPAVVNNVWINWGIHPRGLCYQWADDITAKLITLHLYSLELRRGVAALGTGREHSCVVLALPGQPFEDGLVLDAWRYCGDLAWSVVKKDKFKWKEVKLTPEYQMELRAAAEKLEKKK